MKKIKLLMALWFASGVLVFGQRNTIDFDHVEPPFWWTGMKNSSLEILFHNTKVNFNDYKVSVQSPGIEISEVKLVENPHYVFVTLNISKDLKASEIPFIFSKGKTAFRYSYVLRDRKPGELKAQGFNSSDVVYLIMPDRFSNGDVKNDSVPGMFEGVKRSNPEARHGGDLRGIANHLDYFEQLGITALWLNPVLENNQRKASYHGYAITDLYKVDQRFGSNDDYVSLIQDCHKRGLKVIQDMVMNHIGNEHWLMHDPPEKTWIHQFPEFTRSNYRSTVVSDPYVAKADQALMNNGWFDTTMPDVDQSNELFATYLIQNTLWWIEYAGIDGIRMDTYPYNDKTFMARWCREVKSEYPAFNIVGEVWINDVATTAYWQGKMKNKDGYDSSLPSVTDFPLFFALPQALNEEGGWDSGLMRLYNLLSRDFIYNDANQNLIFLDNHDVSRFFLLCGKNIAKFKMGLAFLLTTRGIPQLYYGTELMMDGDGAYHPNVRLDFPGGWKDDKANAFTSAGRTADENDMFNFLQRLLTWRRNNSAIHNGKLTHYIPENNVYVYFRKDANKSVMVVLNGSEKDITLSTQRFNDDILSAKKALDVISGQSFTDLSSLNVPSQSAMILELSE